MQYLINFICEPKYFVKKILLFCFLLGILKLLLILGNSVLNKSPLWQPEDYKLIFTFRTKFYFEEEEE